jgi:hypothetical protein
MTVDSATRASSKQARQRRGRRASIGNANTIGVSGTPLTTLEPCRWCPHLGYTHAFYATLLLWNALLWSTLALTMQEKVHTPQKR